MFKHANMFDYQVEGSRSENCILIDSNNWIVNTSNAIVGFNSRGGISNTYITEVLDTNISSEHDYAKYDITSGNIVLLTAVSTRMYCSRTFQIPLNGDTTKYTDIPIRHIIGRFEKGIISISSLTLFDNQVLLIPVDDTTLVENNTTLLTTSINKNVFRVVKTGDKVSEVGEGSLVWVRDNIATDIMIKGESYWVAREADIIAHFPEHATTSFNNLEPLFDWIITEDYMSNYAEGSCSILNPSYDVHSDIDQVSEVYNEDRFKVLKSAVAFIKSGDVLDVPREATDYATFLGNRYYLLNGTKFINARIGE